MSTLFHSAVLGRYILAAGSLQTSFVRFPIRRCDVFEATMVLTAANIDSFVPGMGPAIYIHHSLQSDSGRARQTTEYNAAQEARSLL